MGDLNGHLDKLRLDDKLDDIIEKEESLRSRLASVWKRRRRVQELQRHQDDLESNLACHINQTERRRQQALSEYVSVASQRQNNEFLLDLSQQWFVLSDCFHISSQGPFATINGLRLGSESPPVDLKEDKRTQSANTPRRYRPFPGHDTANKNNGPSRTTRVPWDEINGALGQVALLLSTLEQKPRLAIRYRHEILYMGSNSKMGIRRGDAASTFYNLFSDDSFAFFGKRNFNISLQCLLECVLDAAECIRKRDRTVTLPHAIARDKRAGGDWKIGGLSVSYGVDGVEWTRAMKYLLTDLKHLLASPSLGLWDRAPPKRSS